MRSSRTRSAIASRTSAPRRGSGSGFQASCGPVTCSSGPAAATATSPAAAATPSATAWWILTATAIRPSSRPVMNVISHKGLSRRSGRLWISASAASSSARPPGAGSSNSWMWFATTKPGSLTQTGWCRSKGTRTGRRSSDGSRCRRRSNSSTSRLRSSRPLSAVTSSTATFMVCMWAARGLGIQHAGVEAGHPFHQPASPSPAR